MPVCPEHGDLVLLSLPPAEPTFILSSQENVLLQVGLAPCLLTLLESRPTASPTLRAGPCSFLGQTGMSWAWLEPSTHTSAFLPETSGCARWLEPLMALLQALSA